MAYTLEQKRNALKAKIAKLQEQERRVKSRLVARERKVRNHRLIETGAIVESILCVSLPKDGLKAALNAYQKELCAAIGVDVPKKDAPAPAPAPAAASKEDAPAPPQNATYDDDDMGDVPADFAAPAMCGGD